jgi:hypothetical protein
VYSLWAFIGLTAREDLIKNFWLKSVLLIWILAPSAWFLFEVNLLWKKADDTRLASIKAGQELARPFWAAVLAALLLLVPR